MRSLIPLLSSIALASASWTSNLNYRSPSEHHPGLGISLHKVNKRNVPGSAFDPAQLNFTHGVASGDPYPDSVILWTRISPALDNDRSNITVEGTAQLFSHETEEYVRASTAPVCVYYKVACNEEFDQIVSGGTTYTSSDIDYTVKVEARNLQPYTTYYYQFNVCGSDNFSPVGRTKTTPRPDDEVTDVSLAVYSCSNHPFGYFNAYGNTVRKDSVDYVLHLGDYIYEYGNGEYGWGNALGRIPQPDRQILTLYDYRRRHAQYRTDLDLVASHQNYPWIPVWDDHEVADNAYRDGMAELNNTEESFVQDGQGVSVDQRKMNAVRAYFEWMPIRQVEMDDNLRIWRSFSLGSLADLIMLDTRNYDRSITDLYWNTDYIHSIWNDTSRSLMGPRQEAWFYNQLSYSSHRGATWRIIGDQLVFSRINQSVTFGYNVDQWDGYLANRNRTLEHLFRHNISNNIFLAGDSHASWVSDLAWLDNERYPYDPVTGSGAIGVEFGGSAVSSPSPRGQNITLARAATQSNFVVTENPELQWNDFYYRGYYELHLGPHEARAEYFGVPTVVQRVGYEISLANFTVASGANRLQRPVAGGVVEAGVLKGGRTVPTNRTVDTATGRSFISQLLTFGYGQDVTIPAA